MKKTKESLVLIWNDINVGIYIVCGGLGLFMFLCTLRGVWESGMSSQHVQGIVLSSGAIVFSLWYFYRYFRSVGTEKAQYTIVRVLPFVGIVLIPLLIWLL